MGRVTEFIEFINAKKIPDEEEMKFMYSHLSKTEKLKKIRKKYRKEINAKQKSKAKEDGSQKKAELLFYLL